MPPISLCSVKPAAAASPLATFVACAHQMLDPATPEAVRRAMEPRLLAQLPALRAWLADELAGLTATAEAVPD